MDTPLTPASFGPRAVAHLIDFAILCVLLGMFSFVVQMIPFMKADASGEVHGWAGLVFLGAYLFLVVAWSENYYRNGGATPGKAAMRLKVIQSNGSEAVLSTKQILLREVLGKQVFMCATLGLTAFVSAFRKDGRALHDLIAGTRVVRVPRV